MSGFRRISTKRAALLASTALCVAPFLAALPAAAQDATWLNAPGSGDFNTAANWSPGTVPTGTAFFDTSATTSLSIGTATVGGWTFNAGASNYSFTNSGIFEFSGAGIAVNGGSATITNSNGLTFYNTSTAGSAGITNDWVLEFRDNSSAGGATITHNGFGHFYDSSSAGSSAITNNSILLFSGSSSADSATITNPVGASLQFYQTSRAGTATITNGSLLEFRGASSADGATITNNNLLEFFNTSTAGSAAITNGNTLRFRNSSSAGGATITNNSTLEFLNTSTAGGAAITNGAAGNTDFSFSTGPLGDGKLSAGSIGGGGTFRLGANELTVGGNNLSTEVTGIIADGGNGGGTGARLVKTGSGTLTLSGDNTYTGGTTVSAGTLQIGNGGTTGSVLGNITNNAALIFNRSDAVTFSNVISGSGTLQKLGGGTLTLSGINTYTGATTVTGGTLEISGSIASGTVTNNANLAYIGTATAGSAAITNNGDLNFYNTSTAGSAAITNNAGGFLIFNNTSTAGSASITNKFALTFQNASSASSATITNNANASLIFQNASSAGSASITNNGGMYFYHTSTAGSAGITNNATLAFFETSTAGNAAITNGASGDTDFSFSTGPNGDNKLSAGSIGGGGTFRLGQNELTVGGNNLSTNVTGIIADGGLGGGTGARLIKTGSGTMTLSGANIYTGGTTVSAGTLQIGNGGTTGSVLGNITNNAALIFNRSDAVAFGNVISGSGTLEKLGAGTLTLSGSNTYSGGTTISAGTLEVQGGTALSDTSAVTIANVTGAQLLVTHSETIGSLSGGGLAGGAIDLGASQLTVNQTVAGTFAGIISGAGGTLEKLGAGTLTLSGINTYTGATTVTGGTLEISGSIASGTVTNNATLAYIGTATAGSAAITNDGVLNFNNTSTAGSATITNNTFLNFTNTSTAGNAAITNNNYLSFYATSTAGSAAITNGGTLSFYAASTAGSAAITNTGTLDFTNTSTAGNAAITNHGTLTFYNNSTAGSAAITNGGTLSFYDTSTAGNAAITNGASGTADFSLSTGPNNDNKLSAGSLDGGGNFRLGQNELTVGGDNLSTNVTGIIADGGIGGGTGARLVKTGTGTMTLSGVNTYTGGTTISAGTLQIGDGTTGSVLGNITNNAALIFNRSDAVTFGGAIGGSGTLEKLGGGTLTLSGINTYTGATTVTGGTLEISGSIASGTVTNNANLAYIGTATAGSATIASTGQINFNNTSTAGSAIITSSGTVNFINSSSAGNAGAPAQINVQNGGSVNFYDTSTAGGSVIRLGGSSANKAIFNNASTAGNARITGASGGTEILFKDTSTAGTAAVDNSSIMRFSDASTAGSASIASTGTLQFIDNSTAGSASVGSIGATQFLGTSSGGSARLNAYASGTIDFSGLTSAGTTAGSIEGAGTFIFGPKTITVGGNNLSTALSGIIEGNGGALVKTGTGTQTLSGTNTYTGATMVGGGTLRVDGSIAASSGVTVNNGGTLAGAGIVGNTIVNSGGTLAAGNGTAGSSLTVNGTLGLNAASTYAVNVNPATSSFANVSGAATLGGATVNAIFAPGSYVSKKYTILTAGSINGTFGTLTNINIPANFHDSLSYDATHAYLNLDLTFTTPAAGTINGNQNNVANALIHSFNTTGGIPLTFATLSAPALSQAAGETATGSQQGTFNAMTQFMGVMTDPFTAGRADGANAPAYAEEDVAANAYAAVYSKAPVSVPFVARWNVWGAGFGGSQTTDGSTATGSNASTSRLFGVAAGADYFFSPNTVAGFALAGGGTSFGVNGFGSGRSDLFQAGAFVRHTVGPAYLSGALAYGWQDVTTDRTVTVAGIDRLRAQFNANAFSGRAEGGYRFVAPVMGGVGITPYAAGQFTTFDLPAYTEQVVSGANTFALAYNSKSVTATRSELGLRADKSFAMQSAILTLRGRAAWAHDYNPDRAVGATFQTLPGASFVVDGARQASDAALTTASAEIKWMNGWSATGTFEGEFSNVTRSYAGKGVARYSW